MPLCALAQTATAETPPSAEAQDGRSDPADADASADASSADASIETSATSADGSESIDIGQVGEGEGDAGIDAGDIDGVSRSASAAESPLRLSMAYEYAYKTQSPSRTIKNRASLRVEYNETYDGRFSVLFDGKASAFLGNDHRRERDDHEFLVTQAYAQTSIGDTSLRAGVQTLAWGESLLAPITDEISPRDNRELFNFNLEELRIGQPMAVVDHFARGMRLSGFFVPKPEFNKSPADGTLYDFDPLTYRRGVEGDGGPEYGLSWKKNYDNADFTLMAASLVDNDYARRLNGDGTVSRVRERFTLTGLSFTRAMGNFVLRGEAAVKFGKPFNDAALQIVRKRTVETYLGLDYQLNPTLSFSGEAINLHVSDWDTNVIGVARNRQTLLLGVEKKFLNDDLSISLRNFRFWPNASNLAMLSATWTVDDNVTLDLNLAAPSTSHPDGTLWQVRDQKQAIFKIQYQF